MVSEKYPTVRLYKYMKQEVGTDTINKCVFKLKIEIY